eukprot:c43903_g1_i1 orf=74-343(+)
MQRREHHSTKLISDESKQSASSCKSIGTAHKNTSLFLFVSPPSKQKPQRRFCCVSSLQHLLGSQIYSSTPRKLTIFHTWLPSRTRTSIA